MRLAYCVRAIFPQHGYGGLERSSIGLMRHLLLAGLDVALFTRPLPPGEPVALPAAGVSRFSTQPSHSESGRVGHLAVRTARYGRLPLPPNGILARLTNYKEFTEEIGREVRAAAMLGAIDGIYAHGLCAWGVRRANEWGVPLVANPHGMEEYKIGSPLKRLAYTPFRAWLRAAYRAADRVVATDYAMIDEVVSLLGVERERVAVLPNGIDIGEIREAISRSVQRELGRRWSLSEGFSGGGIVGISVGRLEANKGFEHLLRALALVRWPEGVSWRWFFVGEGSLRARLEALAIELGLREKIVFTGRLTDVELHNLYELCNLFAHPTLYEGSSLVTLEAMAHALPVVASAAGGIPDKVLEGESGLLVKPGDEKALSGRLEWMASHPGERAEMGHRGARLAEENFSWARVASRTKELFYDLLDEKAGCRGKEVTKASC